MKRALAFFFLLALAACDSTPVYTGTVIETRGQCWTIMGDPVDGQRTRYAVSAPAGRKAGLKPGQRVTVRGRVGVGTEQNCAAAVVLIVERIEVSQ